MSIYVIWPMVRYYKLKSIVRFIVAPTSLGALPQFSGLQCSVLNSKKLKKETRLYPLRFNSTQEFALPADKYDQ